MEHILGNAAATEQAHDNADDDQDIFVGGVDCSSEVHS